MKLGEKIKQLRQQAGLTQPELAEKAGIEQSYLSKLENDKGSPSFEILHKIASAFETDVMLLIASLDSDYVQTQLGHLPEVAAELGRKQEKARHKMRTGYIKAAFAIVFGLAFVILSNSSGIFSQTVFQYKSMGLIKPNELNSHYSPGSIHAINETREHRMERIAKNKHRINELLVMSDRYRGEGFVQSYGEDRRYFSLVSEREQQSPWPSVFLLLGMASLATGGLYMIYVFKFIRIK
ncbi:helix-turn-helix domain-containing protein [Thalassotalea sediminis]|uniref:helix-turn-helix domain-containing protein n=1 Tax=Thalassotalea sediminis TaxID=1759089 RepID=UPI0025733CEC|nr:helix-turn-helix domain-containing protein [Thalassotalea sediminis]